MPKKIKIQVLLFFFILSLGIGFSEQSLAYLRIISLKPNITEILFELGVGEKVVGVTTYCTRPEEAKNLPRVADYIRVNNEKVLRLEPDLVIGSEENSSQKEIHFLQDRGIPVFLFPFSTVSETVQSIEKIGNLLGKEKKAKEITKKMKSEFDSLRQKGKHVSKKRVLFVVGYQPLVVAGGKNFFDEASQYIGAINVAHESRLKYPTFTTELLIRSAPEVIVDLAMGSEDSNQAKKEREEWWGRFPSIPAVKNDQIFFFDIEKMRAVPSLTKALNELFCTIHP